VPAPDLDYPEDEELRETAIEAAVLRGHANLLPRLKPDPARDNFEELFQTAPDGATVDALAALAPPRNMGTILARQAFHLDSRWPFETSTRAHRCAEALKRLFQAGGRWTESPPEEIRTVRQDLLRASDPIFVEVMKLFVFDDYCAPAVLQELTRTPSMRQRMTKVGLLPSVREEKVGGYTIPHRVMGDRNVMRRFGIATPKEKKPLPPVVHVGPYVWGGQTIRLDRRTLYERVWSEPVERIAKAWELSGRGLAKACKRLKIPVPPRGYWAKARHGRRPARTPLRELPGGEGVEIVVHAPAHSA
jgi:hypothetical protein